jgi:membrane protease YdiL (CAAX protease family)
MSETRTLVGRHPVLAFVVVTYAFSWLAWSIQYAQADPMGTVGVGLFLLGGLGPLVGAAVVARHIGALGQFSDRLFRWRVHWGWYLLALIAPFVTAVGVVAVGTVLADGSVRFESLLPVAAIPGVILSGILLGGLEEPGWRGFAQARLQRRYSAFAASLLVGASWVGWHLPLFVIPGTSQSEFPVVPFVVMGLALAVVFAWAFNSTGGSVPVLVVFHGAYNGALGWSGVIGAGDWTVLILVGGVTLVGVGVTAVFGPESLSIRRETTDPIHLQGDHDDTVES